MRADRLVRVVPLLESAAVPVPLPSAASDADYAEKTLPIFYGTFGGAAARLPAITDATGEVRASAMANGG